MKASFPSSMWIVSGLAAVLALIPNPLLSQGARGKPDASAPLKGVVDTPMPGPAVRFDYQSIDADDGRLI
jgi:hypothetical protein